MEIELANPNWFDIVIFSIVGISTLFAFFKGFIRTFFSLMVWIVAAIVAAFLHPQLSPYLAPYIPDPQILEVLSYIVLFIVSLLILMLINWRLLLLLDKHQRGVMDRTLGFGFGLVRGALIVSLIFISIDITSSMLNLKEKDQNRVGPSWFVQAKTYQLLKLMSDSFVSLAPDHLAELLESTVDNLEGFSGGLVGAVSPTQLTGLEKTVVMSSEEKEILKRIIRALPEEGMAKLYAQYNRQGNDDGMGERELTHLERMSIYRDIIELYDRHLKGEAFKEKKAVSDFELERLKYALSYDGNSTKDSVEETPEDASFGYKGTNIKQLNRLMNNLSEQ